MLALTLPHTVNSNIMKNALLDADQVFMMVFYCFQQKLLFSNNMKSEYKTKADHAPTRKLRVGLYSIVEESLVVKF